MDKNLLILSMLETSDLVGNVFFRLSHGQSLDASIYCVYSLYPSDLFFDILVFHPWSRAIVSKCVLQGPGH